MAHDDGETFRELAERATRNTTRIEGIERELSRARDAIHEMRNETAAVVYIGRQVGELAERLDQVAQELGRFSRRAMERPTPAGWSAGTATVSTLVAIAALLVAIWR